MYGESKGLEPVAPMSSGSGNKGIWASMFGKWLIEVVGDGDPQDLVAEETHGEGEIQGLHVLRVSL